MTTLAELGIQVESRTAIQAKGDLDKLVVSAIAADKAVDTLGKTSMSAATEMQKIVAASTGMSDEFKDAAASASVFEAGLDETRASFEALRASIDPVYAASMKYADAIDQIAIAQQVGAISQAEANSAFLAAERRFLSVGEAGDAMGDRIGNSSHNVKMLGFQLSQIAQQGAATGMWMQALTIQAADIGASFGLMGMAVGVLATIALPTAIAWFNSTTDSMEATKEAVSELTAGVDAYISAAENARVPTAELTEEYGRLAPAAREALNAIADAARVDALNKMTDAIKSTMEALVEIEEQWDGTGSGVQYVAVLADDFGMASSEAQNLVDKLQQLRASTSLEEKAAAALEVQRAMKAAYESVDQMPRPLRDAYVAMGNIVTEGAKFQEELDPLPELLEAAANAAASAANMVASIGGAAAGAYGSVSSLVSKMYEMAQARAQMFTDSSLNYGKVVNSGGVDAIARAGNQAMGVDLDGELTTGAGGVFKPTAGGGGGGGGGDDYQGRLDSLLEELRAEADIETEWYEEQKAILEDRRAQEYLGEEAHKEAMVELEEEYQRRLRDIEMEARQRRISDTASLFGALADIASVGGKKTAKIVATFQAIEGTVNAYGAALKALNTPGLTLAGRFAAYASVLAAGLKGVMAIRSAGGVGGGSGDSGRGGGLPSTPSQGAEPAGPKQVTKILGIRREDLFTGEMIYNLLKEEKDIRGIPMVELVN